MANKKSLLKNEQNKTASILFALPAFLCRQMEKATASKLKR